jgi:YVTN family beta-propeller protein
MISRRLFVCLLLALPWAVVNSLAQQSRFNVLAFYTENAEPDHVHFAKDAVKFLTERAAKEHFTFEATTKWDDLNDERLKSCQLVIWLNESPAKPESRQAFERYVRRGGAWLGFHAAGYNDKDTNWPWFVDFLGGAIFDINSWPPLPARLTFDDVTHPIAHGIPSSFESPANEWYVWKPSPRLNKDVRVLLTLARSNYPIGFKDVLTSADLPAVWTNTKYRMLYMNMGHGDKIFTSSAQNSLIDNAVNWLATAEGPPEAIEAKGIEISPTAVQFNPGTGKFYAVNTHKGLVTVLSGDGDFLKQITVGKDPEAIAVNPETNRIYVANNGSGSVSVIDSVTDTVIATVSVGELPYAIAANARTDKVYVAKTFSNIVTALDGKTNIAEFLKPSVQPDTVTADPALNRVYLTSYQSQEITVLDGTTDQASGIRAADHIWAIAINPAKSKIYAANAGHANIEVIDGKSQASTVVNTGEIPCAVAIDSKSGRVFVVNYACNSVTVIDGVTDSVVATVDVAPHPQAIAVDSNDHKVYVVSPREGTATILDGAANSVLATLETGKGVFAIAVDSKTHKAVAVGLEGELMVIDGTTLRASPAVLNSRQ